MEFKDVKENMESALSDLFNWDNDLIENDVNERSITHWLAIYMGKYFENYNIDYEYNRNLDQVKILNDLKSECEDLESQDGIELMHAKRRVYPDIIVHKRGTNKDNLLVIEVKKFIANGSNSKAEQFDLNKLIDYTTTSMAGGLNYSYGMYINLNKDKTYDIKWFEKGEEMNI